MPGIFSLPTGQLCEAPQSLEALVSCVKAAMPGESSEGFVIPDEAVLEAWQTTIQRMLDRECDMGILPAELVGIYSVNSINGAEGRSYCALYESLDANEDGFVDRGWGTFIVNNAAKRNLDIAIPHPLNEANTPEQGIAIFEDSEAGTFTMAGAHRRANAAQSTCQQNHQVADVAHNVDNFFHQTLHVLIAHYEGLEQDFTTMQFHGMAETTCPGVDVYLTNGFSSFVQGASESITSLKVSLGAAHPSWVVTVPGDTPSCGLSGTTNVQGRLANSVDADMVCSMPADENQIAGQFIHVEQKRASRTGSDWFASINEVFPARNAVNNEPAAFMQNELLSFSMYPNPVALEANISIQPVHGQHVKIELFDILGKKVQDVFSGYIQPGDMQRIRFTIAVPPGAYLLRLQGQNIVERIPVVVISQ